MTQQIKGMSVVSPAGRLTAMENNHRYPTTPVPAMIATQYMTYQSLTAELEQEQSALEDLHMFFVAFQQRKRKIIEQCDAVKQVTKVQLGEQSVNENFRQERALQGKTDELNVEIMEQEITIEI